MRWPTFLVDLIILILTYLFYMLFKAMNGERSHNKESVLFCEHPNNLMRQHMRRSPSNVFLGLPHRTTGYGLQWLVVMAIVAVAMTSCPRPAKAIEMFTFFGDGSRVPLGLQLSATCQGLSGEVASCVSRRQRLPHLQPHAVVPQGTAHRSVLLQEFRDQAFASHEEVCRRER